MLPAAHHVAVSTENLCKTADHNIRVRKDMHIEKIADRFVDDDTKIITVGELSDPKQIG